MIRAIKTLEFAWLITLGYRSENSALNTKLFRSEKRFAFAADLLYRTCWHIGKSLHFYLRKVPKGLTVL